MKAIILVAGYATRLYPLTKDRAKALLDVGGQPIIDYIADEIDTIPEVDEVIVVSNHRFAEQFEEWAAERRGRSPKAITVLDDGTDTAETRLGAIGDIAFAIRERQIDDDLMVIAGDNLFTYPLEPIARSFIEGEANVILGQRLGPEEDPTRFAIAEIDEEGRLLHLEEKPAEPRTDIAIYATYFYKREVLPLFETYLAEGNNPDAPGYFPAWLYTRRPVRVHQFEGTCYDIGTHESYALVQSIYSAGGQETT